MSRDPFAEAARGTGSTTVPDRPDPDATRISIRALSVALIPLLALFAVPMVVTLLGALCVTDEHTRTGELIPCGWQRWAGMGVVTLRFGPLVGLGGWLVWRSWRAPVIEIDQYGVWLSGGGWNLVAWSDIAGVGLADGDRPWWRPRRDSPSGWRLEIYPATEAAGRRLAALAPRCQRFTGPPPYGYESLPHTRYLVRVPDRETRLEDLHWAVLEHCPRAWIGRYRRLAGDAQV